MKEQNEIKNAPVTVTVASDQEPVKCNGVYSEDRHGFCLEFSIGNDKFRVEHGALCTRLTADGVMSYDIELKDEETSTLLATPYGAVRFKVKTIERNIVRGEKDLNISIKYVLTSDTADVLERDVELSVEI